MIHWDVPIPITIVHFIVVVILIRALYYMIRRKSDRWYHWSRVISWMGVWILYSYSILEGRDTGWRLVVDIVFITMSSIMTLVSLVYMRVDILNKRKDVP